MRESSNPGGKKVPWRPEGASTTARRSIVPRHTRPAGRDPKSERPPAIRRRTGTRTYSVRCRRKPSPSPKQARTARDDVRCRGCDTRCRTDPKGSRPEVSAPSLRKSALVVATRNPDLGTTAPVACALTLRPRRLTSSKEPASMIRHRIRRNPTGRHRPGCDDDIDIALRVTGVAVHGARLGHA